MTRIAEITLDAKDLDKRWSEIREDFWGDLKEQTLRALKKLMETTMEVEITDLIGASVYERNRERLNWRNGHYARGLATSFGDIPDLEVPRLRKGKLSFSVLKRYQRRAPDVDAGVLNMFLAGVSTRRIKEVLDPLMGPSALSATTVSRISKVLNSQVQEYHHRELADNYQFLILDGVYLKAKSPIASRRRCILVVYGIKANGVRELIDFRLTRKAESQAAWEGFLTSLRNRGLEGRNLKLSAVDGNKGLWNALDMVYPDCPRQRCWAHKLRNVIQYIPKKLQEICANEARDIYNAKGYHQALQAFKHWKKIWNPISSKAVQCLEEDLEDMLVFFKTAPESMWVKLRTTNIIERVFREVRRRTRPMSCFENAESVERIIYAIFHRQNEIWKEKPLVEITQKT